MSTSQVLLLQPKHNSEINRTLVPTTSTKVVINDVKIKIALWGCRLQGKIPYSEIYSRVKAARKEGTYNEEIRRAEEKKIGAVIEIIDNDSASSGKILPVTMTTATTTTISSSGAGNTSTVTSVNSIEKATTTIFQTSKCSKAQRKASESSFIMIQDTKLRSKMQPILLLQWQQTMQLQENLCKEFATYSIKNSCLTGRSARQGAPFTKQQRPVLL